MSVIKTELATFFPTPFLFCDLSKKTIKQLETAVIKDFRNDCEDFDTYLKTKNAEEDHQLKQNLTSFCKAEGFPIYQSTQELQLKPDFNFILRDIFSACRAFEGETNIEVDKFEVSMMWSNIYRKGGHNPEHFHPNSFLSGIICVNDPIADIATLKKENYGGTTFYSPINQNFVIVPTTKKEGSAFYTPTVIPQIKKGNMIIFPSWLRHAATPYPGVEDINDFRITVSFNIMIRGTAGKKEQLTWNRY